MTLSIKQLVTFNQFTVRDFGLQQQDRDAHTPSLYLLRKSAETTHADRHQRSAAGQKRDTERRTLKKRQARKRRRLSSKAAPVSEPEEPDDPDED